MVKTGSNTFITGAPITMYTFIKKSLIKVNQCLTVKLKRNTALLNKRAANNTPHPVIPNHTISQSPS